MTEPAYINNSLKVAFVALLQSLASPVLVVAVLCLVMANHEQEMTPYYRALAVLGAALSFLLLQIRSNGRPLMMTHPATIALRLLVRWVGIIAIIMLAAYLTQFVDEYSSKIVTAWIMLVPMVVIPVMLALHFVKRRMSMASENVRSAVFVGFNPHSQSLASNLRQHPELCTDVLGFFDDRGADRLGPLDDFQLLGGLPDLGRYVRAQNVEVIFIALPIRHLDRVMNLLDDLQDTTASIYYVPDVFVFDLIQSRSGEILDTPVISLCETPFYGSRGVLKRVTDVGLTLCALIPALPVMLVVAILVWLTSRGPVIFAQRRYGLDGHEIVVYKFRSMYVEEDGEEIVQVSRDDPRVTPVGAFLRKYSLDELPQFINVLQGRMSLVGPRPHAVAHNEAYRKLIKGYMLRHKVLPGITGLAQVSGCRGEISTLEEMEARVRYDLEYLREWSPMLDIRILFLTVFRIFHDSKAY